MSKTVYRTLQTEEVNHARQLFNRNPDVFAAYALERLPCFYELADTLESVPVFVAKQRLMLGAFSSNCLVGSVFVRPVNTPSEHEVSETDWELAQTRFSEHELNVYCTLASDLKKGMIDAPSGSLLIHSLCVEREHRGQGIAAKLLTEATNRLSVEEQTVLYVKVARNRGHIRMCESLGFRIVRKRLSLSDRLQFGCWGSTLLQYIPTSGRTS